MSESKVATNKSRGAWLVLLVAILMAHFYWLDAPVMLGIDPHDDRCLPDMHVALMLKKKVESVERGDLLFWKPRGSLSEIKQAYVLKQVAGVAGDRLVLKGEKIFINGQLLADGLPLVDKSKVAIQLFDKDEVIPPGMVFMYGVHPRSNDSRYWGYLPVAMASGKAWEIF